MWRAKPPDANQVRLMALARAEHDLRPLVIHANYLINLASGDGVILDNSVRALRGEMERALIIGAEYLVIHPGNYKGLTPEQGLVNVAKSLALAWRALDAALPSGGTFTLLLENTAGAGAQLGGVFAELATIRELASPYLDIPIGYCLDTCHCYVAGFDISTKSGLNTLMGEAEAALGWQNVPVMHTNDAKTALGSHVDRHANIGEGHIGLEGFRRILNHPELRKKAFILETPVDEPGDDLRNVTALKNLVAVKSRKRQAKR